MMWVPPGHLSLIDAIEHIGRQTFQGEWTGRETSSGENSPRTKKVGVIHMEDRRRFTAAGRELLNLLYRGVAKAWKCGSGEPVQLNQSDLLDRTLQTFFTDPDYAPLAEVYVRLWDDATLAKAEEKTKDDIAFRVSGTEHIGISPLAVLWSGEIGQDASSIANALLDAAIAGEFDNTNQWPEREGHTFPPSGLLRVNKIGGLSPELGQELRARALLISEAASANIAEVLADMVASQRLFLTHEAVQTFAVRRDLSMPSKWRHSPSTPDRPDPEAGPLAEEAGGQEDPSSHAKISTRDEAERWYQDRVNWYLSRPLERWPSREDDVVAGRRVGLGRDRVRKLREKLAPADWKKAGAPRKSGK